MKLWKISRDVSKVVVSLGVKKQLRELQETFLFPKDGLVGLKHSSDQPVWMKNKDASNIEKKITIFKVTEPRTMAQPWVNIGISYDSHIDSAAGRLVQEGACHKRALLRYASPVCVWFSNVCTLW